jgi:hypothetical protein
VGVTEVYLLEHPTVTVFVKRSGILHREDGPAAIFKSGHLDWYIDGVQYGFETWCELLNKTPKEIMFLKLKYS